MTFVLNQKNHENCRIQVLVAYTNKQSISSHFRLSANHVDKQVMLHFLAKEKHPFCSQYNLISDVTLMMLRRPEFVLVLVDQSNNFLKQLID